MIARCRSDGGAKMKYDIMIYEGGDLAVALTEPDVSLVQVRGTSESDMLDLSEMLCKYGVDFCIIPHEGD